MCSVEVQGPTLLSSGLELLNRLREEENNSCYIRLVYFNICPATADFPAAQTLLIGLKMHLWNLFKDRALHTTLGHVSTI